MTHDRRLIEAGFPCHQVGAETQRERDTGQAPPPNRLHVWWARRPLTPSRAAILASLEPAGADPDLFIRRLGIERMQVHINGNPWILTGDLRDLVIKKDNGTEVLKVSAKVRRELDKEQERRGEARATIGTLKTNDPVLAADPILIRWEQESQAFHQPFPREGAEIAVERVPGDPAHVNDRIAFAKSPAVKAILGKEIRWAPPELYGYDRAFSTPVEPKISDITVLDPTAGGGSIPFEALRLGYKVIANDLNPVATVIQYATLDYPARFGPGLAKDIEFWGNKLLERSEKEMEPFTPFSQIPPSELKRLTEHLAKAPGFIGQYDREYDHTGLIYCRMVKCPHCEGEAPLLNTCWLSKEGDDPWGVRVVTDGRPRGGTVKFETYRIVKGKGPNGEDPEFATVNRGTGLCIHCRQAIDGDEIKAQAQGKSPPGKQTHRLYAVVAVRLQPKLDKNGQPERFKSGEKKGQIKTEKIRFFRPPNDTDLAALQAAEQRLREKWDEWERSDLIPSEEIPENSNYNRGHRLYGMTRWIDMFTPRQLLGHCTMMQALNDLKPDILAAQGCDRGRAVVTYL